MNKQPVPCDDDKLMRLLRSDEDDSQQGDWIGHVEHCGACQSRLRQLAADDDTWKKVFAVLSTCDTAAAPVRGSRASSSWDDAAWQQLLQPPSHPEMLGRLGRYEIERTIGSGGMGIVFKAFDTELNRVVAIKVLGPHLTSSGAAKQRFARESRAAAGVRDDHVVQIYNVESETEPPFLVMQYIAGGSLQEKVDRDGPLQTSEILRIGFQAAGGLAAAHAQGLIHRDIKPSNILLDQSIERALLTDFGLARTQDDASLTCSGFHPGTPHYMSPEQIRGEALDGRSDLFSLGCVLYTLCTGHPPFRAETAYAVFRRITDDIPRSIRQQNPDIPDWLEQIVFRLLAKSPHDRFDSAQQVTGLLQDCLAHVRQPSTTPLPGVVKRMVAVPHAAGSGVLLRLLGGRGLGGLSAGNKRVAGALITGTLVIGTLLIGMLVAAALPRASMTPTDLRRRTSGSVSTGSVVPTATNPPAAIKPSGNFDGSGSTGAVPASDDSAPNAAGPSGPLESPFDVPVYPYPGNDLPDGLKPAKILDDVSELTSRFLTEQMEGTANSGP